jgi:hypothetical protein
MGLKITPPRRFATTLAVKGRESALRQIISPSKPIILVFARPAS